MSMSREPMPLDELGDCGLTRLFVDAINYGRNLERTKHDPNAASDPELVRTKEQAEGVLYRLAQHFRRLATIADDQLAAAVRGGGRGDVSRIAVIEDDASDAGGQAQNPTNLGTR